MRRILQHSAFSRTLAERKLTRRLNAEAEKPSAARPGLTETIGGHGDPPYEKYGLRISPGVAEKERIKAGVF